MASTESCDLFLSYSWDDRECASKLALHLTALGVRVWHDESRIQPGDSIRYAIEDGIGTSRFVGLLLSSSSLNKLTSRTGYLRFEEYLSSVPQDLENRTVIIPILIEEIAVDALPLKYRDRKIIHISGDNYGNGIKMLLKRLGVEDTPAIFRHPLTGAQLIHTQYTGEHGYSDPYLLLRAINT